MKKVVQWIQQSQKNKIIALIGTLVTVMLVIGIVVIPNMLKDNKEQEEVTTSETEEPEIEIVNQFEEDHSIVITAEKNTEFGVPVDSAYILEHEDTVQLTKELVQTNLVVEPAVAFDIEEVKPANFKIRFKTPLPENKIVRMKYTYEGKDFGYAFQTEEPFWLRSSYPADQSNEVPVNSGIEMTFSRKIDAGIEGFITIEPAVEGKIQIKDNKLIFMPEKELDELTSYTINVNDGYTLNSEQLDGFTFSFMTTKNWDNAFSFTGPKVNRFSMDSLQTIYLSGYLEAQESIDIKVYRIDSQVEEILALDQRDRIIAKIDETQQGDYTQTVKGSILTVNDYTSRMQLNQNLPKGLYYLAPDFGSGYEGAFVQVTTYYAYMTADEDSLVVWIEGSDDLVSEVSVNNTVIGKTGSDGIGIFDIHLEQEKQSLITLQCAEDTLYLPMNIGYNYKNPRELYYAFLMTDRQIYMPTDTIHIHGYIHDRMENKAIETVTLQLVYSDKILESKTVEVSDLDTYISVFELKDYHNQWLSVQVLVGDEIITSYGVNVFEFEKPKYVLKSEVDKRFIKQNESFEWTGNLSYYSGTPVKDGSVILQLDQYNQTYLTRTSNKRDTAEITLTEESSNFKQTLFGFSDLPEWRPIWINLASRSDEIDNFYLYSNDYLYLFPSDRMIEGTTTKIDDSQVAIDVATHSIDVNKIKNEITDPDEFRGEIVAGMDLSINIIEYYTEQVFVKQAYNEIYKETYDVYDYIPREASVYTGNVTTDETGNLHIVFDKIIKDRSYQIYINGQDSTGHPIEEVLYYGNTINFNGNGDEPDYQVVVEADNYNEVNYNQEAAITLIKDGKEIEASDVDKMLIIEQHDGIKNYVLTDSTRYDFVFDESYMPNTQFRVVYFTGEYIKASNQMQQTVYLKRDSKQLNIDITYDKETYRPGETVKYTAQVTDKDNIGIKADFNISVVDEAIFALMESFKNPIDEMFYMMYDHHILGEYIFSYNTDTQFGGAEMGGEGGPDGLRDNFENTAFFETVTTDDKGMVTGSFKLPDNITQWRATLTAFSEDVQATSIKTNVYATLPLFVDVVMEDKFLAEDTFNLLVKSAGDASNRGQSVTLNMSIKDAQGKVIKEQTSDVLFGETVVFEVGKLPVGTYELHANVKQGAISDALMKEFQVVESRELFVLNQTEQLSEKTQFIHNNAMVTLEIMNEEARKVFEAFESLLYGRTERRENMTAQALAAKYIDDVFYTSSDSNNQSNASLDEFRATWLLGENNFIAPLPNAQGEAFVSAILIHVGIDQIMDLYQLEQLRTALWTKIEENFGKTLDYNASLWALSNLGEPMLLRANDVYDNYDALESVETKLCLIQTFATLGETTKAKNLLAKLLNEEDIDLAQLDSKGLSLADSQELDESYRASLLSILVDLKEWDYAQAMYTYILEQRGRLGEEKSRSVQAELYYYLSSRPQPVIEATLDYNLLGKKLKETIDFSTIVNLTLTPEELDSFEVNNIDGELVVRKSFIGAATDVPTGTKATLSRSYMNKSRPEKPIEVGDEVLVTFKFDSDEYISWFALQDSLPAGLTYIEALSTDNFYMDAQSKGNTVEVNCYVGHMIGERTTHRTFSYIAIATLPGEYLAEESLVYIPKFEESARGEESWVTIK